ncbi:MAG: hypothetical protein Q9166_003256 [cf. Caloplaca sp. 2 TL-2023]
MNMSSSTTLPTNNHMAILINLAILATIMISMSILLAPEVIKFLGKVSWLGYPEKANSFLIFILLIELWVYFYALLAIIYGRYVVFGSFKELKDWVIGYRRPRCALVDEEKGVEDASTMTYEDEKEVDKENASVNIYHDETWGDGLEKEDWISLGTPLGSTARPLPQFFDTLTGRLHLSHPEDFMTEIPPPPPPPPPPGPGAPFGNPIAPTAASLPPFSSVPTDIPPSPTPLLACLSGLPIPQPPQGPRASFGTPDNPTVELRVHPLDPMMAVPPPDLAAGPSLIPDFDPYLPEDFLSG